MISVAKHYKRVLLGGSVAVAISGALLVAATVRDMREVPEDLHSFTTANVKPQLLDRHGRALTITYQNQWNAHDQIPLHRIPLFLQSAFILAEDKRFYSHTGIDWSARIAALMQNVIALDSVRGASTISEQVIRMLHPRKRSLWARWLEGWEARELEQRFDKATILEFYLNQVPFAAQRRGVQQATRYYFDRDTETLSQKEMLALAVLVRAPSRFDLHKSTDRIAGRLNILLERAVDSGLVKKKNRVEQQELKVVKPQSMPDISHFAAQAYKNSNGDTNKVVTTLDAELQATAQDLLDKRLNTLSNSKVSNAGMIVVDHLSDEILVWAVGKGSNKSAQAFDTILVPRQPGSTLKPFVYAAAMEQGWTAATMIDDSPLQEGVGRGVHTYRNYSNNHYGPISLRNALGNSLNIPAIKAAQFVGVETLIDTLNHLGIDDLKLRSVDYGNGIALGNAEISLYSLVEAYATLARGGIYRPIKRTKQETGVSKQVFDAQVASIIADILSDADARALEFGSGGTLSLPIQTAVKTGTSNDYRDAWTVAFNHRYVVGVWMGNLDNTPMQDITGSRGPAPVLRAMFSELNRNQDTQALFLSRKLISANICTETGLLDNGTCRTRQEWFARGTVPSQQAPTNKIRNYTIAEPVDQTLIARDPRIPDEYEAIEFRLDKEDGVKKVDWFVNDRLVASTSGASYYWPLEEGGYEVRAQVYQGEDDQIIETQAVSLIVK